MPAVLTHKAIMLMARERLADVRDALEQSISRKSANGVRVVDLERKLLALAREAYRMMSAPPTADVEIPGQLFARPLEERISKFAVMGAMGPDITGFSALFAPGQVWVFDTIHKGTPDSDRELLMASTCDFALELWAQASAKIATDIADPNAREAPLAKIRAYVLGHLCHIAGDVVSHPFINDLEWHLGTETRSKIEHSDGEGSHDAMVARRVFARDGTRDGQAWDKWWPSLDEVPAQFFQAYADAMEAIYDARTRRPRGFGEFEQVLRDLAPPALDAAFVRDGYAFFRSAILSIGYGFGFWLWFLLLIPVFLVAIAMPLIGQALPHARQLFNEPGDEAERNPARRDFELFSFPIYLGAVGSLIYGSWVASLSSKAVGGRTAGGIITSAVTVALSIAFFVDSVQPGKDVTARWLLLFAAPLAGALTWSGLGIGDLASDHRQRRSGFQLIHGLPAAMLVVWLIYLFFFAFPALVDFDFDLSQPGFWVLFVLWCLVCIGLWIFTAFKLRDARIPEAPDTFAAQRRHAVRLFDDATLFTDPVLSALQRPARFFPSGRRPILKLWWEGDGTMSVRSDRYGLAFKLEADGATHEQAVPAPVAPMTVTEYIRFLERTVENKNGTPGQLKSATVYPDPEEDYELPPGATFANHGDTEKKAADRESKAAEFKQLGGSADDTNYILYHAPKPLQAIRFTPQGPIGRPFDLAEQVLGRREDELGYAYIHDQLEGRDSETVMSYAADVAALLCMGAAPRLATPAAGLDPVYQVFRNWNLDRRRVNEWRMLVAGRGLTEKGDHPEQYDPALPHGRHGPADPATWTSPLHDPADPDVVREGERTARDQGWVPLLRRWLETVRTPGQDLLGPDPLRPDYPSNRALSRGLAFLFDLSDPRT